MFKKILIALSMMAASVAFAANIDTSGLTDAQVAELKAQAAKAVAETARAAAAPVVADPKTVDTVMTVAATWGTQAAQAAEGFAKALGIAAKELGVTVNDFLHTDAGKLTALLIIWKVAGAAMVKCMYGLLFITVGLTLVRVLYKRLFTKGYEKVEYSYMGGFFKGTKLIRIPKNFGDLNEAGEWLAFWVMLILAVAVMIGGGCFFI